MTQEHLRLRLLGPFSVNGELRAPVPVGKARRALAVLAVRAGEFVPVGALVEALWDTEPPARADRNVAALVSRLRRALGRDRIDGTATGYRLVTELLSVDLAEAIALVRTAERELAGGRNGLAAAGSEQAAARLAADVAMAGEREDPWVQELRISVARWLRRARICWGTAALEMGSPDVTVEVGLAALRADPLDEEAGRLVMAGHRRAGRSSSALEVYRQLRTALREQLGVDPAPDTESVYLSVLRAEQPAASAHATRPAAAGPVITTERAAPVTAEPGSLVGRDTELARLRALWSAAVAANPALAVLTGEAGIGKSSLLETFVESARRSGSLVVPVRCFEAERSLYLQPLAEAVRLVANQLPPAQLRELASTGLGPLSRLVPELTELVGDTPYERAGPELEHHRALDALAGFFVRLSARRPVLLAIEDAQHAGGSTIQALHLLASRWSGSRILALITERTSEQEPVTDPLRDVAARWLELGPLSCPEVAVLVQRSGVDFPPERFYSWTGGSPLFVTELLRHFDHFARTESQPSSNSRGTVWVPRSLSDSVAARIAHAGEDTAALLAQGAVLGASFNLDEVAALSRMDAEDGARAAQRALRAGLLVTSGDSFRFANDIVREVAYASAPEPVRTSRHRRAARLLADRPEAAAGHHAAAGDFSAAAQAWEDAARTAHLAFANNEAVELLGHAVSAARSASDLPKLVELLLRRGQAWSELGRYSQARADHEAALELARAENYTELEARALEQLGWTALFARDALHAVDFAERATELAESAAAAPGALPSATLLLGRVRHWDGEYAGAEAAYQRVLASDTEETTTALALAYQGALLQHQDRFAEARSVLARAAVLCRRTGEFRPMLQTLFFTALARGDVGDFGGALRALDNARRLIDAEKVSFYRAGIETTTSWLWQELGQVHRAREHAERAVELAHRGGGALELEQELHALLAVADCELMLGNEQAAGRAVESAAPLLDTSLPFRPRALMRLLEMRSRWRPEIAEQLLDEARRYSSRKYQALALRALGQPAEAALLAQATRSDLLVGQLGADHDRHAATDRIATALPESLRHGFVTAGRLNVPTPRTH